MANTSLSNAKKAKNDEFYTQLSDIENELKHYKSHFTGKVVYCNCDDARKSNFFRFFQKKFSDYGLKKLVTTSYNEDGHGSVLVYEGDTNGDGKLDDNEVKVSELKGNGDFRSEECIELLKEADIVVTNPPFSLFRVPQVTNKNCEVLPNGDIIAKFGSICWFTNLDIKKRHEEITLYKKYNEEEFPKYDNYDAIEVSKVCEIPKDYDGVMGVPITFLYRYNPSQFEIVKFRKGDDDKDLCVNGKCPYFRILIKRK